MNALIACVGKLKESWQKEGCEEYLKRLSRYGKYEIGQVPDEPEPERPSDALSLQVMQKEGRALLRLVKPGDFLAALCVDGKALSSTDLAAEMRTWENSGRRVVFAIGGSLGLSPEVIARADARISFSRMTFPHGLMRVILLEQLYRAERINAGERYHK